MTELENTNMNLKEDLEAMWIWEMDLNDQIGQLEQWNDMLSDQLTE